MIDSPSSDSLPRWLWRLLLGGSALTLLGIAVAALLLAQGAADPPVAGPVVWHDEAMLWAGQSPVRLDPGFSAWIAAPDSARLPTVRPFTLSVIARLDAGSAPGATWGIWAASPDGSRIVWAVRGDGYLTIRQCPASALAAHLDDCPALIPDWRWHAYPRIYPPGESNRLTLHREPDGIRLRLNHEILGLAPVDLASAWGVWLSGDPFAADSATAHLSWQGTELRAAPP